MKTHSISIYSVMIASVLTVSSFCLAGCHRHKSAPADKAVRVTTFAPGCKAGYDSLGMRHYSGTIQAATGSDLSFLDAGTVRRVHVNVGDRVAKGKLLAELDNAQLSAAYDMANAQLSEAQDAYRRLKMLHDAKALPEIKWVEMQSKLHQAESAVEIARKALSNTKLYAPAAGVIASKSIEPGMNVAPAVPVLRLVSVNNVRATIGVPESEIGAFAEGTTCSFTVDGAGDKEYTGTLIEKGVEADPITREFTVKFGVDNPDSKLLPGMICRVVVSMPQGADAKATWQPVLPVRAVLLDFDNRNFVWIKKNGKAEKRYVTAESLTPSGLLITEGLEPGDSIIVDGQQKVSTGMAVTEATDE